MSARAINDDGLKVLPVWFWLEECERGALEEDGDEALSEAARLALTRIEHPTKALTLEQWGEVTRTFHPAGAPITPEALATQLVDAINAATGVRS